MKKAFQTPEICIEPIGCEDVLTASLLSIQDSGCKVKDVYDFMDKFGL